MAGLLGHISAEDREWMEREGLIDSDRGIGPLGSHEDDDDWFSTTMNLNERINVLTQENEILQRKNGRLKKENDQLKKRLRR